MKTLITKENIESVFRQKVNELTTQTTSLTVTDSLHLAIDFFTNYEIKGVDTSIPDNDMLLFEYGIYDWQDGKGENFTVDLTRQFYMENGMTDGFFQLHLVLYFESEDFRQIEAFNKWSDDFAKIDDWRTYILNTEGFKQTEHRNPKSFDIFLVETD